MGFQGTFRSTRPVLGALIDGLGAVAFWPSSLFGAAFRRRAFERDVKALEALDDVVLADIGLTRHGIRRAVAERRMHEQVYGRDRTRWPGW